MSLEISADLAFEYRSFWRPKDAERVIDRMFALHPEHPLAYDAALDNLHAHGRLGEALLTAERGLESHPEDQNLLSWHAWLLLQVGLLAEAEVSGDDDAVFYSLLMQGRYEETRALLDKHLATEDPSYWYSNGRDYLRVAGAGPTDPEFSRLLDKSLAWHEKNNVQWRERCMLNLVNDLQEVGRGDEVAGMMQQCNKQFEERLKVQYLCPCTFFGVVMYTILDGRLDEAAQRADEWLSNGDSMSFLPQSQVFNKLKDRPEYPELLARNEEQLERQRQIYLAGREAE
jgi:tetratricopeptide (TPR) repeat protein